MMITMYKKTKAIALVMVLMIVTILVVVVSEFAYSCKVDVYTANNQINELQNRYALVAFLNQAIGQIQLDSKIDNDDQDKEAKSEKTYDSLYDPWRNLKQIKIEDTIVKGNIVDESRKFNILSLVSKKKKDEKDNENKENQDQDKDKDQDKEKDNKDKASKKIEPKGQFLNLIDNVLNKKGDDAEVIYQGMVDWLKEKKGKSEDKFPDKVALYSINELILAQKIDAQTLWGNEEEEKKGLANYITIWSKGKININTASKEVLMSTSSKMTSKIADAIISAREGQERIIFKKTSDLPTKVSEVTDVVFQEIQGLLTVDSEYFTVTATAKTERVESEMHAVLYRKDKNVYTIYCEFK